MDMMLDARERAPLAARPDMYLDASGRLITGASIDGPLAAAIPGTPAALAYLAEHYGRLPLRATLAPAVRLARAGVAVTARYQRRAAMRRDALRRSAAAARVFLTDGQVPAPGAVIVQPDLAATMEKLAQQGAAGFYQGPVAQALVSGVREAGGIWSSQDLAQYRVIERAPVRGEYRGIRIISASPPSAGGIALIEALNILSGYRLDAADSVTRKHLIVEALRRAYRDRAQYLGDPDFVQVPVAMLLHPYYAAGLRGAIRLDRATRSDDLAPVIGRNAERAQDTTHFCVLDREGNRVAATLTINYPFGSGFMAPGTGVLLNDEMDDFSSGPGLPNVYGLTGGQANAIAPGKRPLSSMTPTFLEDSGRQDWGRQDWGGEGHVRKDGGRIAAVGTPGGSRIISMLLLAVLDFADGKDAASWVAQGRFHYGNMQAWLWDLRSGRVQAASDPRGEGSAEVLSAPHRAHGGTRTRRLIWAAAQR
jgi:gamma-glutamyltranspeptidase/glutathione hydrolase